MIGAADALHAGLADIFIPSSKIDALQAPVAVTPGAALGDTVRRFATPLAGHSDASELQPA